jgi:hypothetical protein
MKKQQAVCANCLHYYITWDKHFPFGCKAMGFKSKAAPNLLTKQLSGMDCLAFVDKSNINNPKSKA